ncbi:MAG: DUF1924 domain-containing protein [Candidatus Thiodiazotropha sp.]
MLKRKLIVPVMLLLPMLAQAGAVDSLLETYRQAGAADFSAVQGETRWKQSNVDPKNGQSRSCSDCHTANLKQVGKHAKTGKKIDPMAPSVNPQRLTDAAKIEKWFKRNCNWTLGRACTPQEKGDYLLYLRQQ